GTGLGCITNIGLVDHCTFNLISLISGYADGIVLSIGGVGNATTTAIWNKANVFGDVNYVYIEDCTFTAPNGVPGDGAIDAYNGAKYIFRHNTVINTYVGHHGYDSGGYRST